MKKSKYNQLIWASVLMLLFLAFTIIVKFIDIQMVATSTNKPVGLATINKFFMNKIPFNENLYKVTNYLGYFAILITIGFAVLTLVQWIKNKSFKKIDPELVILGIFYVIVILFYILFELVIINYRPIIIDGELSASYPSSHTMLAVCILISAMIMLNKMIKNRKILIACNIILGLLCTAIVIGRLLSGVHWFTDIIGALILSASLIMFLLYTLNAFKNKQKNTPQPQNINFEE